MTNDTRTQAEPRDEITFGWSVEDVQQIRADLSDKQARKVLQRCEDRYDADIGMNWDILSLHADNLFPSPPN
jgi:hypothetical protein